MAQHYVSITGIQVHRTVAAKLRYWWFAIPSMMQAQKAVGNISTTVRSAHGVHHTLSVWQDEASMRRYLIEGAHLKAMKAFGSLGTGSTHGYLTDTIPDWDEALRRWHAHARKIG